MGADLLVVPRDTLVNITASLLTVQPTDATLPADLADKLTANARVARVAPQRIVPVLIDGHSANLIAFELVRDFSVLLWLDLHQEGPLASDGIIAGSRVSGQQGGEVMVCGKQTRILRPARKDRGRTVRRVVVYQFRRARRYRRVLQRPSRHHRRRGGQCRR